MQGIINARSVAVVIVLSALWLSSCGKVVNDAAGVSTTTTGASTTSSTTLTTTSTSPYSWISPGDGRRFNARGFTTLTAFASKLWLIGGSNGGISYSDVWSSSDGSIWTLEANALFPVRSAHAAIVDNNALWIISGNSNNDIWSSSNGSNWTQATGGAEFPARQGHSVVKFNDKLYIIGGGWDTTYYNDVWSSTNEANWVQVTAESGFETRNFHGSFVLNDQIWVIGGASTENGYGKSDIWSSVDGVTWEERGSTSTYNMQTFRVKCLVTNETVYLVDVRNKLFKSTDGINWETLISSPDSSAYGNGLAFFDNKLWLAGGYSGGGPDQIVTNEVWYCPIN